MCLETNPGRIRSDWFGPVQGCGHNGCRGAGLLILLLSWEFKMKKLWLWLCLSAFLGLSACAHSGGSHTAGSGVEMYGEVSAGVGYTHK